MTGFVRSREIDPAIIQLVVDRRQWHSEWLGDVAALMLSAMAQAQITTPMLDGDTREIHEVPEVARIFVERTFSLVDTLGGRGMACGSEMAWLLIHPQTVAVVVACIVGNMETPMKFVRGPDERLYVHESWVGNLDKLVRMWLKGEPIAPSMLDFGIPQC